MATTGTITMARGVLDAVHRLAPAIAARAGETEAARRVPPDLLDDLRAAGVFRMLRPPSYGGMGADLLEAMDVFEALSRADASVGWTCMIGAGSWRDIAGLPRAGFDEIFAGAPDAITAGVFNPTGAIAADGDAYRVTGRWSFASGSEHADWLYGNCVEGIDDGVPRLRIAAFAPDQVTIEDTWNVSGLCGTGSHHFRVDAARVPAARTTAPLTDPPCLDVPFVRVPRRACSRSRSPPSPSGSPGAPWTTWSRSPPTRCRCSTTGRSPRTRRSSWPSPPPSPTSPRPGPS
jgi:alkylation response protein AidB-like acyl-CoA dehydrogenase